jgi:hypothetical protein
MIFSARQTLKQIARTWSRVLTARVPIPLRPDLVFLAALLAAWLPALNVHATSVGSGFSFVLGTGGYFDGSGPFAECSGPLSCSDTDTRSVTGTFDLFDPALGTLTGVTMVLDSTLRVGTEILGTGNGGTATATGEVFYEINGLLSGSMTAPPSSCTPFCNVYTPGGTQDFPLDATIGIPHAMLPSYIGAGTASQQITETVMVNGTASNGVIIARTRTNQLFTRGWEGTVTFVYDYQPVVAVPEPVSGTLLGIGLIGIGMLRRRRSCSR